MDLLARVLETPFWGAYRPVAPGGAFVAPVAAKIFGFRSPQLKAVKNIPIFLKVSLMIEKSL